MVCRPLLDQVRKHFARSNTHSLLADNRSRCGAPNLQLLIARSAYIYIMLSCNNPHDNRSRSRTISPIRWFACASAENNRTDCDRTSEYILNSVWSISFWTSLCGSTATQPRSAKKTLRLYCQYYTYYTHNVRTLQSKSFDVLKQEELGT